MPSLSIDEAYALEAPPTAPKPLSVAEAFAVEPETNDRKFADYLQVFNKEDYEQNPRDVLRGTVGRLPFVGAGINAAVAFADIGDIKAALNDPNADDETLMRGAEAIAYYGKKSKADPDFGSQVLDGLFDLPGFAAEFALTGGAYNALRSGVSAGVKKATGKYAQSLAVRAAEGIASRAAGVTAQTLANPQRIAESMANKALQDTLNDPTSDQSLIESLPAGFLDTFIEIGSERAGGKIVEALSKIPGAKKLAAIKNAITQKWLGLHPESGTAQFITKIKSQAGWNGVLGEIMEERVGESARNLTGLEDKGVLPGGWKQLGAEALTFMVPGITSAVAQKHFQDMEELKSPVQTPQPQEPVRAATESQPTEPVRPQEPQPAQPQPASETTSAGGSLQSATEESTILEPEGLDEPTVVEPPAQATQAEVPEYIPSQEEILSKANFETKPDQPRGVGQVNVDSNALRELVPGATVMQHADNHWRVTLPSGRYADVVGVPNIFATGDTLGRLKEVYPDKSDDYLRNLEGAGYYQVVSRDGERTPIASLIAMSEKAGADQDIARHETVHWAKALGLWSDAEWNALKGEHAKGMTGELEIEEAIARGLQSKKDQTVWQRIKDFFRGIAKTFGFGDINAADAAKLMQTPEFWARAKPIDGDTTYEPESTRFAPLPANTSPKNAAMAEDREAMLYDAVPPASRKAWKQSLSNARAKGIPKRAMRIADEVVKNPRQMTDEETAGVADYAAQLKNEYRTTLKRLESGDEADQMSAIAEGNRIEQDFDILSRALKLAGTETGRALAARKLTLDQDYNLLTVQAKAKLAKGGELTPAEKASIKATVEKLDEATEKVEEAEKSTGVAIQTELDKKLDDVQKDKEADKPMKAAAEGLQKQLELFDKWQKEDEAESLQKKITKAIPADLRSWIQKLANAHVKAGVAERNELVDKVLADVNEAFPDMQRREVMDLISGYGEFSELSKDAVSVKLRELKGELQQIGKLEDMAKGEAPKKTGIERREPSEEERRLIKEVNEAKKAGGYKITDPERQLKSALETIKTRLTNQIKDLKTQIDSRQKLIKQKRASPSDSDTQRLTAERDALKEQFDRIFGKPEITDQQRIAIAKQGIEKSIEEYQRRLDQNDFGPQPKNASKTPNTPEIEALRKKRDELKAKYAAQPKNLEIAKARARLAELATHLENKTLPDEKTQPTPRSKLIADLRDRINAVRKGLNQSEPSLRKRYEKQINELTARLARNEFGTPEAKTAQPVSPEIERLAYERDRLRIEIQRKIRDMKPKTIWGHVSEPFNFARSLITTMDLPPIFRQGGFIAVGNPARAGRAAWAGMKAMFSDVGARRAMAELRARPNAPLYAKAKLYLAEMDGPLSTQEEAFMSRWKEKVPLAKQIIGASERNYTVFLNRLRADTFDAMVAGLSRDGQATLDEAKAIATYINVATGRGAFGSFEAAMSGLAPVFFSPRYVGSRFQLLAGQPLYHGTMRTRKAIAQEYGKFLLGTAAVAALGIAAGADWEDDPRSSDFGKLRFGNTRLDPLAGLSQTTVLLSRLASGQIKKPNQMVVPIRGSDVPYQGENAADMMARFVRSKLAPLPGAIVDLAAGEDVVGEPVTPASVAQNITLPLSMRDISGAIEDQGVPKGTAMWLVSLFGMGLQTYRGKDREAMMEELEKIANSGTKQKRDEPDEQYAEREAIAERRRKAAEEALSALAETP